MAYELRDMSGSVFTNNRRDRDTSPDFTGTAKISGQEFWINAWRKVDKNGNEWFSFAFKEKQANPNQQTQGNATRNGAPRQSVADDIDDSIPF